MSRNIPESIKRDVRKRCNFGCVICGFPFYHYDHIEDYAKTKEHEESNITLLCATHHDKKTKKLLPKQAVIEANNKPYAVSNPDSLKDTLYFKSTHPSLIMATNRMFTHLVEGAVIAPFVIYSQMPIYFKVVDSFLLLNMSLYDDGVPIVKIVDNELQLFPSSYDIKIQGSRIRIYADNSSIIFDVDINPEDGIINLIALTCKVKDMSVILKDNKIYANGGHNILSMQECSGGGNVFLSIKSPEITASFGQITD